MQISYRPAAALAGCLIGLLAAGPLARAAGDAVPPASEAPLPAGTYQLDPLHASLTFKVNHLGMSYYTARFTKLAAQLQLDPADPTKAEVTATVDPASLDPTNPPAGFIQTLLGPDWLNVAAFPDITFRSTAIEQTGPNQARILGELGLHGVTQPVELDATFNGGYAGHPMDPGGSRIGFSAQGRLQRSAFGIAIGIPAPGTTLGVSDAVAFAIEAEFTRPADAKGAAAQP